MCRNFTHADTRGFLLTLCFRRLELSEKGSPPISSGCPQSDTVSESANPGHGTKLLARFFHWKPKNKLEKSFIKQSIY